MSRLFDASSYNHDVSQWDTAAVTDMKRLFRYSAYNHSLSYWDTSQVTSVEAMFYECDDFDQDLSSWVSLNKGY